MTGSYLLKECINYLPSLYTHSKRHPPLCSTGVNYLSRCIFFFLPYSKNPLQRHFRVLSARKKSALKCPKRFFVLFCFVHSSIRGLYLVRRAWPPPNVYIRVYSYSRRKGHAAAYSVSQIEYSVRTRAAAIYEQLPLTMQTRTSTASFCSAWLGSRGPWFVLVGAISYQLAFD